MNDTNTIDMTEFPSRKPHKGGKGIKIEDVKALLLQARPSLNILGCKTMAQLRAGVDAATIRVVPADELPGLDATKMYLVYLAEFPAGFERVIGAIKQVRYETGIALKEAKDVVDRARGGYGPQILAGYHGPIVCSKLEALAVFTRFRDIGAVVNFKEVAEIVSCRPQD